MAKHEYKIKAVNGKLFCYKDGVQVQDWCFLKGENMPEMKLFVDGVGVATKNQIIWEGLTDYEYNALKNSVEVPDWCVEWSKREVDPVTGEITVTAKRTRNGNSEICVTVLDKDCRLIKEKCSVTKV